MFNIKKNKVFNTKCNWLAMIHYNRNVNPDASNSHINSKSEGMRQKRLPGINWEHPVLSINRGVLNSDDEVK